MSWAEQAECKDHPENLWFGAGPGKQERALAICNRCPVKKECLEDALATPMSNDHGTRGGTSARERDRMRAARKARSK